MHSEHSRASTPQEPGPPTFHDHALPLYYAPSYSSQFSDCLKSHRVQGEARVSGEALLQRIFRKYSSRESGESVSDSRSAGAGSAGAGPVGACSAARRAAIPTAVLLLSPAEMKRSESCANQLDPPVVSPGEPGGWMATAAEGDAPAPPVVVGDD